MFARGVFLRKALIGGAAIDAEGTPWPDSTLKLAKASHTQPLHARGEIRLPTVVKKGKTNTMIALFYCELLKKKWDFTLRIVKKKWGKQILFYCELLKKKWGNQIFYEYIANFKKNRIFYCEL